MVSRYKGFCHVCLCRKSADNDSISNSFRHRYDVRPDTILLIGKHFSGSPHTTLYFIADHHDIMLGTKVADSLQKFFVCRINAAFALNRLYDNGIRFVVNVVLYTIQIVVISKMNAGNKRCKRCTVFFCSGYGQCPHTSSVKCLIHRNDFVAFFVSLHDRILSCQLQSAFIGLCTAVCHKYLVHSGRLCQTFCCLHQWLGIEIIGKMCRLVNLVFQRVFKFFITVTKRTYGDSCAKIKIFFSFGIYQIHVFAMIHCYRIPIVGMNQIFFGFFN